MRRTPEPTQAGARVPQLWLANFIVALAVLLALKYGLVINNIVGTEGFAPAYRALPKSLLFLGFDALGAALWAGVITLLVAPLRRWAAATTAVSVALQAAHAAVGWFSFMSFVKIGSPLSRESIALAVLDQPAGPTDAPLAVWSSFVHLLTPAVVITFLLTLAGTVVGALYAPRLAARLGRRARRRLLGACAALTVTTAFVLPILINVEVWGSVHTWGLERSPVLHLAWSYVEPALDGLRPRQVKIDDAFIFDLTSPFPPEQRPENPLRAARPQRTNVLFISLESIGQLYVEQRPELMPTLTAFGDRPGSVFLGNHHTTWPQTMKAFFSIFCSELPYPTYKPITYVNPGIPCRSLSEVLHGAGYFTALLTSADLGYDRKMRFFQHRDFDLVWDMRNMPGDDDTVWRDSWGLDERLTIKNITRLMGQADRRPFFIFYEMAVGHHPYYGGREHEEHPLPTPRENYERAMTFVDARVQDLIDALDALGIADETLTVVLADHGEGFNQHPGSRSHGPKVHRENVWVPFGLMGPQLAGITGEVRLPTSHIDVAPTILGLVGLDAPCSMKGRDLTRTSRPDLVLFAGRSPAAQAGLIDGRFKYILEENGAEMLFDLSDDAGERENRLADNLDRAHAYRERLEGWAAFSENLIERYAEILGRSECRL